MPVNLGLLLCESLQNVFPQQQEDNMPEKSSCAITVKGFFESLPAIQRGGTIDERQEKISSTINRIPI